MWQIITNREGLLRHLGAGKRPEPQRGVSTPGGPVGLDRGELALIWEGSPAKQTELPEVIVVADGEVRSFLAWATTYLDGFRPFTALCRVMDCRTFDAVKKAEPPRKFSLVGAACAVTVLADAMTQGRGRVDENTITIAACESTYSFLRAKMLICGLDERDELVRRNWNLAREIAKQPPRFVSPDATEMIWHALDMLSDPNSRSRSGSGFIQVLREYMETGTIADRLAAMTGLNSISKVASEMEESREHRVTVLDHVLRGGVLGGPKTVEGDMIRGYVASLLSPGTVEYFSLVSSYLDEHPTLLMWYAVFAGLHPQTKVLSQFGGLCRRLLRDIEQREMLFERPRCDIAVEEMEVLTATGPSGLTHIRGGSQGAIRVEVYPTITAPVRIAQAAQDQPGLFDTNSRKNEDPVGRSYDEAEVSKELDAAISILDRLYAKLRTDVPATRSRPVEKKKPRGKRKA